MNKPFRLFKRNTIIKTLIRVLLYFSFLNASRATDFIRNFDLSSTTTLDPSTTGFTILGARSGSYLGDSLETAGDINKDGYDDLLVGASSIGEAYVIYGGPTSSLSNMDLSTLTPTAGFKMSLSPANDYFGLKLSSAGDINKDGYDDFIVGAPRAKNAIGIVFVIYGGPKSSLSNMNFDLQTLDPATTGFTLKGAGNWGYFGWTSKGVGDINKDGYDDILFTGSGKVYVMYGGPTSSFSNFDSSSQTLDPATTGFTISGDGSIGVGGSADAVGDVNKDGYADFALTIGVKTVYVIFGGEKSSFPNLIFGLTRPDPVSSGFKISVSSSKLTVSGAGDVNGDGYDDIIIGASDLNNNKGGAYVIYGGPMSSLKDIDLSSQTLDPAKTGFTISGSATGDEFGSDVRRVGDINKDGYSDISSMSRKKATTYIIYGGPKSSRSNIDLSSAALDPQTTGFIIRNIEGIAKTGGDINRDGYDDVLVAHSQKQGTKGVAYVIHSVCVHTNTCPLPMSVCPTCGKGGTPNPLCANCPSNCQQYENDLSCEICKKGYFLSKGPLGGRCEECLIHCTSCKSAKSCQACEKGYELMNSFCVPSSLSSTPPSSTPSSSPSSSSSFATKEAKAKALQTISATTTIVGSVMCVGNTRFPLSTIVSTIVQSTRFFNLTVTGELAEIYQTWDTELISWEMPTALSEIDGFKEAPAMFAQYGLVSPFLVNFWSTLMTIAVGLAVFVICFVLKKQFERSNYQGRIPDMVQNLLVGSFNFVLVQVYSCLDGILFNLVLDVKTNPFNTFISWLSVIFAFGFMAHGCYLVFCNFRIVKEYQRIKTEGLAKKDMKELKAFCERKKYWELFYADSNDDDFWSQSALAIFIIRSTLTSLLITVFYDYPLMQTAFMIIIDGVIILYLFFHKPFTTLRGKLAQYYFEIITLLVHICAFAIAMQDSVMGHSAGLKNFFCGAIIYLNIVLVIGGISFMSIEIYKMISEKVREGKKKKYEEIATQTGSQGNVETPDMTEQANVITRRTHRSESDQASSIENFHLLSSFRQGNDYKSFTGMMNLESSNHFRHVNDSISPEIEMTQSKDEVTAPARIFIRPKIRKVRIHQQEDR